MNPNHRFQRLETRGLVRLTTEPDDVYTWEDIKGDTYDPIVNDDIDPAELRRQEQAELQRMQQDGVYGLVGEFNLHGSWHRADSIWGFIGNDWQGSGYDDDIRNATVRALRDAITARCRCCHGTGTTVRAAHHQQRPPSPRNPTTSTRPPAVAAHCASLCESQPDDSDPDLTDNDEAHAGQDPP